MGFYDRKYRKRGNIFFIFGVFLWMFFGSTGVYAACVNHDVNNVNEAIAIISKHWEEDYFEEMIVQKGSNSISVDHHVCTFADTFSADEAIANKAVSSEKALESFLDQEKEKKGKIYEVEELEQGNYSVKAPFQSKRIVILSAEVEEDFGAAEKYIYRQADKTILQFETEEETQIAYQKACTKYGKKQCYVDEIIKVDNLAQAVNCYTWGGEVMGMDTLRTERNAIGKAPVTVAVLDTGIDSSNIIFQGKKILPGSYNFMNGGYDVKDTYGHGTHVAGIIANLTPDNVHFLILKVTNETGESTALSVNLALDYAIACNVDVINLSMGFLGQDAKYYTFLDEAINNAYKKGIPVCAAAGNDDTGIYGKRVENCYPACNSQAITVSSIDSNKNLAWYSCKGSTIDFTAPGTDVISAGLNGTFVKGSGTSMAAPHLSAAMAYMKLFNKHLSVDGCCMELKKRCQDLGARGWDMSYGYGYPKLDGLFQSANTYGDWTVSRNVASPVLLSCSNTKDGVKLSWRAVKNADGYYINCKRNGELASRIACVGKNQTQFVDTGASDGQVNIYYIEAFSNRSGGQTSSGRSNYMSFLALKPLNLAKVKIWKKKNLVVTIKGVPIGRNRVVQIQYSKQKNFKKVKTKSFYFTGNVYKFAPKMKGTLYVRVRTRESLNRKKYYSFWSKVKKVKVK
ncbi:MAG: S8 family serine peptidase [Eubacteriales bacterium]|nr:S8 family serine peptidase [Eubacteriales bacterium]